MTRKERLDSCRNYVLYYGTNRAEEMIAYDLAIVEPKGQKRDSITMIQKAGTLVLAYLSIVELQSWSEDYKLLQEEDFLQVEGRKLVNEAYGTYMADLRSARWQRLLQHRMGSLFTLDGYDGIFLDTIGNLEAGNIPAVQQESLLMAARQFLGECRQLFKERLFIQNNGLEKLCIYTADYLDGICWENPPLERKESAPWSSVVIKQLQQLQKRKGLKIMLLLEEEEDVVSADREQREESVQKVALDNKFLYYLAPPKYL